MHWASLKHRSLGVLSPLLSSQSECEWTTFFDFFCAYVKVCMGECMWLWFERAHRFPVNKCQATPSNLDHALYFVFGFLPSFLICT